MAGTYRLLRSTRPRSIIQQHLITNVSLRRIIMNKPRFGSGGIVVVAMAAAVVLSSCTCKIKEDQLASIKQLRAEEKQLTADIEMADKNATKLKGELGSRQGETRRCIEQKSFVEQKLQNFPNVWPDWDPNAPDPVEPTPPAPQKRR
jgi:outer membrane murein-binding lipoprotein Lpp